MGSRRHSLKIALKSALLITLFGVTSALADVSQLHRADIKIKGLVCAFCAQALLRNFEGSPEVGQAKISLETGTLSLVFKPGQDLSESQIDQRVRDAGFRLDHITREPTSP